MLKKSTLLALVLMLLAVCACEKAANETAEQAEEMTIANFNTHAADYVDQVVTVAGTVDHVCKHSGKRLFIFGEDPAERLKIEAGTDVASFDVALEGSEIRVQGKVLEMRMDEAYLDQWEKEETGEDCTADMQATAAQSDDAEDTEPTSEAMTQIEALRKQLAESEKGYIGFYSLECVSFEELKQEN